VTQAVLVLCIDGCWRCVSACIYIIHTALARTAEASLKTAAGPEVARPDIAAVVQGLGGLERALDRVASHEHGLRLLLRGMCVPRACHVRATCVHACHMPGLSARRQWRQHVRASQSERLVCAAGGVQCRTRLSATLQHALDLVHASVVCPRFALRVTPSHECVMTDCLWCQPAHGAASTTLPLRRTNRSACTKDRWEHWNRCWYVFDAVLHCCAAASAVVPSEPCTYVCVTIQL
jgi:hypothetical protein